MDRQVQFDEVEVLRIQAATAFVRQLQAQLALAELQQQAVLKAIGDKYGGAVKAVDPATGRATIVVPEPESQTTTSESSATESA